VSRRTLWTIIGGALAVVLVMWVLAMQRNWIRLGPHAPRLGAPGADVRAFLGPLTDGGPLNNGAVARVYSIDRGALPMVLTTAGGHRCGVMVLKHEAGGPQGVANTSEVSIFLGNGGAQTVEEEAQTARALATALADRAREAPLPPSLLTLSERQKLPGGARLQVPLD
jgi:hypothetical protein